MPTKTFDALPHAAARDHIAGLPLVSRDVLDEMMPELKAYFFTVKGIESAEQLSRIRKHLADVPDGATWEQKKKAVAAELETAMNPKQAARRAETLMRTHVYRAYAAARYRTLMSQRDIFPFWMYKISGKGTTRPSHRALANTIWPAGHPIWQTIFPPWGWGCLCLVVPLTRRQYERYSQRKPIYQRDNMGVVIDAELLPDQRIEPTIYTPDEADLIGRSLRLPGGISLEPEPSWGRSPWSEKGGVKHTWEYVQHLYGDDPVVLDTFRQWAAAKVLPDMGGATVLDWLEAESMPRFISGLAGPSLGAAERAAQNRLLRQSAPSRRAPVSELLDVTAKGAHAEAMKKAGLLINHVHDDGDLRRLTLSDRVAGGGDGSYLKTGQMADLAAVHRDSEVPITAALHEIGHHIRHVLDDEDVKAVLAAAEKGSTLAQARSYGFEDVFFDKSEVFSRAYAQFVAEATRAVDGEAWLEIDRMLGSHAALMCFDKNEWPAIASAVKVALKKKGWFK